MIFMLHVFLRLTTAGFYVSKVDSKIADWVNAEEGLNIKAK